MRTFIGAVSILFFLLARCEQTLDAADLHAIFVADFFSMDIQKASYIDLQKMHQEAQVIAKYGHFKLKATLLAGDKTLGKKLLKAVKNLRAENEDVILFYFSGHGYRTSTNSNSPWPYLDFPAEHSGICFKGIIDALRAKQARLAIVMADCCNWAIPDGFAPPLLKGKKVQIISSRQLKENYRKLFCQTAGVIAVVSAQPGEASYCGQNGSFYTLAFLNSLCEVIETDKHVKWQKVFDGTGDGLQQFLNPYNLKQKPHVLLDIKTREH